MAKVKLFQKKVGNRKFSVPTSVLEEENILRYMHAGQFSKVCEVLICTTDYMAKTLRFLRGELTLSHEGFITVPKVIRDAFCQDEYVSIGAEVNKNPKAAEELLELCADAALDGVSLVAVEINTGEVVSVSFNKIQIQTTDASEKPFFEIFAEERCTQASSRSLIQFMANVDARCNFFEKFGVDCSLELMFLATLREHRKQKLATLLSKYSIDVAKKVKDGPFAPIEVKDLGPKYSHLQPRKPIETYPKICQAIWTSEGSQRIGKVLNFTVHLTVPLSEFVFDGKTYSERIGDDSAFCEVAALIL